MENITFDSGVETFQVGRGVLRFNPADPNLYARFLEAMDALEDMERQLPQDVRGKALVALLADTDRRIKTLLSEVFGPENDLEAVFGGVSLLAVGGNGQRIIVNFLEAIEPVLRRGAMRCARAEAEAMA